MIEAVESAAWWLGRHGAGIALAAFVAAIVALAAWEDWTTRRVDR